MTVILAIVAVMSVVMAFAADSNWENANAKYKAGDFKGAAGLYETVLSSGHVYSDVYYNLADAYFRLGKKGKALINYERAIRIAPRDADARWNVAVLKSVLPDRVETQGDNLILEWIRSVADKFTINEIGLCFAALMAFFVLLAFLNLLVPQSRAWTGAVKLLVIGALCVVGIFFWFKWLDVKDPRVVVLDKEVYARYGPSDSETKAFLLHEGAEAKVIDETSGWFYVTLDKKTQGWLPKNSCEIV